MIRRWMIALLILLAVPVTAFSEGCSGYIRLKMSYNGKPVSGGTVTLYDVSDSHVGIDAAEMAAHIKESGIHGIEKEVNGAGEVLFDDLEVGQYLMVQEKAAPGYYPIKPFLIHLKTAAGGTMVNSVDASPKMEPEGKLPQTGQLVWPAWVLMGMGASVAGIGLMSRKWK